MLINLYGKEIELRDNYCSLNNLLPWPIERPYINLYVRVCSWCNAKCSFCVYRNGLNTFNFNKFMDILNHLKSKVEIRKISFTGGEPTSSVNLLNNLIKRVRNITPFIVVNTNGFNIKKLLINDINSIALSRHHYDDSKNNAIFKTKTLTKKEIQNLDLKNLHLSCNVIKGQIDSKKEIEKYLNFAISVGVTDVGFVSLMKVNKYCEDNFVDFTTLLKKNTKNIKKYKQWQRDEVCQCNNYVYAKKGKYALFYNRHVLKQKETCTNTLLYNGEHLISGFNNKIIY